MARDIKKAVLEYETMIDRHPKRYGLLLDDVYQIIELAQESRDGLIAINIVYYAMRAAFVIGYRAAKRDMKRNK